MIANSHCELCRYRTVQVVLQGELDSSELDPNPSPAGEVWLTGRRLDGSILAIHADEPSQIPRHVAFRYERHRCPTNGGA